MPKTRQQRIAEERAGHAPSPPHVLTDKPRGPRRTRAKTPSAHNTAVEGPVVPSQPVAAPGPEAPRALEHVWVDENRYVYDPSHEYAIPSALVPELFLFLNKLRDHNTQHSVAGSSSSTTQVTPSLNRRQFAHDSPISYAKSQLSEPSAPVEPPAASSGIVSPFQETSPPLKSRASFARIEQPFQQFSGATAPLSTPAHVRSPPQETSRSMAPHDSLQARPMPKSESSMKRKTEASGTGQRKKRAMSGKQSAPPTFKWKLTPMPTDPEKLRALGLSSALRKYHNLPSYTANGEVRYGNMEPSDDDLKVHDEAPSNTDPDFASGRKPQTPQASSSSTRVVRPTVSVKRQFGFSPLTTISEQSETTPSMQPAKTQPPMRVPSRLFDRMNAEKRKRGTSPESILKPKGAEEDEDEVAWQQPGKVRRTSQLQGFSSQGAANSVSSRPCTGQQSTKSKPPVPITNKAGAFKVPSPGDSDWSDSQSEDEGSSQVASAPSPTIINPGPTSQPQFGATAFEDWLQTASPSVACALERMDVDSDVAGAAFQRGLTNHTTM